VLHSAFSVFTLRFVAASLVPCSISSLVCLVLFPRFTFLAFQLARCRRHPCRFRGLYDFRLIVGLAPIA